MQTIVVHTAAPPVNVAQFNAVPARMNPFTLPMLQQLDNAQNADMARRRRRRNRR